MSKHFSNKSIHRPKTTDLILIKLCIPHLVDPSINSVLIKLLLQISLLLYLDNIFPFLNKFDIVGNRFHRTYLLPKLHHPLISLVL